MFEKREMSLTEDEYRQAVAFNWLRQGFVGSCGGYEFAEWLEKNRQHLVENFINDNSIMLKMDSAEWNKEMVEFVEKNKVGFHADWRKFKDGDRWWLFVYWEME